MKSSSTIFLDMLISCMGKSRNSGQGLFLRYFVCAYCFMKRLTQIIDIFHVDVT